MRSLGKADYGLLAPAMFTAAAMIAHQVAGKATRDTSFFSVYNATDLPKMTIAAAGLSLLLVLLWTRLLGSLGPRNLVPAGFLASAVLHVVEWQFYRSEPRLFAPIIYLHIAAFGAILLSGFWSLVNEAFDPHSAKGNFGKIAGAGTAGGILGGLLASRIAAYWRTDDVLLLLAAAHLSCCIALMVLRRVIPPASGRQAALTAAPISEVFSRAPYLRPVALLVLLGTASAALVDYIFRTGAKATFSDSAALFQFFAAFYTVVQVMTFLAQTLATGPVMERFGLARAVASLPTGLGGVALAGIAFPIFPVFVVARAVEGVLRGSLFRSGYEILFTPMAPAEKRSAKTFIDVGCDRMGDALGAGAIFLFLYAMPDLIIYETLALTAALCVISATIALRLDRVYADVIESRLVENAPTSAEPAAFDDSMTFTAIPPSAKRPAMPRPDIKAEPAARPIPSPVAAADTVLLDLAELRSGDAQRVKRVLASTDPQPAAVVAQAIRLLAWDDVYHEARHFLSRHAYHNTGLFADHLLDQDQDFAVRRRLPRILAQVKSQRAAETLVDALSDTRFEVRFQASRALDSLTQTAPGIHIPAEQLFEVVSRELSVARPIWQGRKLLDRREAADSFSFLDDQLKERADQGLEHIFSLLACVLPREPLKVAFRALHTDDRFLRGLGLEYMVTVLPEEIREKLWAILDLRPGSEPAGGASDQSLTQLLQNNETLLLKIRDIMPGAKISGVPDRSDEPPPAKSE